jgi:hypothetical protein
MIDRRGSQGTFSTATFYNWKTKYDGLELKPRDVSSQ